MKKQATTTRGERQLKFAEAGVLFVLILGLTLFVGTKVVSRNSGQDLAEAVSPEPATEVVSSIEPTIEPAGVIGSEEVAVAAEEIETSSQDLEAKPPRVITYALSEQAYFNGNFEEAADLFTLYTEDHPGNAWGHYMLGLSCWKAGNPEAAEEAFLAALDLKPDHQKSLVNYGRVLLEMARADEAKVQLEAALAIDPHSLDANRVLGRVYHSLGLLDEAAASYRTVLAIKIDDVWALNNLGLIYIQQERFADALPPLARAARMEQESACIQNNLGIALERSGHFKDSVLAFERALEADEEYTKAEQSLERVGGLAVAEDTPALDLELVAASFSAGPIQTADTTEAVEPEPVLLDDSLALVRSEIQEK